MREIVFQIEYTQPPLNYSNNKKLIVQTSMKHF